MIFFFVLLLCSFAIHGSSSTDNNHMDVLKGALKLHVSDPQLLERSYALVAAVRNDNKPPLHADNTLKYPALYNPKRVILRKRELNDGVLPVSGPAKKQIVAILKSNPSPAGAFQELQSLTDIYDFHPLSVQKMHQMLTEAMTQSVDTSAMLPPSSKKK